MVAWQSGKKDNQFDSSNNLMLIFNGGQLDKIKAQKG
jgi:hypothetical protein